MKFSDIFWLIVALIAFAIAPMIEVMLIVIACALIGIYNRLPEKIKE